MSEIVRVTRDPLDVGQIFQEVAAASTGAVSIFVGTTRDNFEGKKVVRLEYEAYIPMAEKIMQRLCGAIRSRFNEVLNVAIVHRLGAVGLKEASVVIAVSSSHRKDSLEAVEFAINELKASVPIWKNEVYEGENEGSSWKQNKECKWATSEAMPPPDISEPTAVDPSLIQISASQEEIEKRIDVFRQKKRAELDKANVLEFCNRSGDSEFSCARVDAVIPRNRKDTKSHLRQSAAVNVVGPQTTNFMDPKSDDPLMQQLSKRSKQDDVAEKEQEDKDSLPSTIKERVETLETRLGEGRAVPKGIYERLKVLEDKVRFLEGLSLEHFDSAISMSSLTSASKEKEAGEKWERGSQDSLTAINERIQELQKSLRVQSGAI